MALATALALGAGLDGGARGASAAGSGASGAAASCAPPSQPMRFGTQTYVDTERAGGEPTVETHPDGTLLYGGHASTTLLFTPRATDPNSSAYLRHYRNQTYIWRSDDLGETWDYVRRDRPPRNTPGSGFSDPDFAIDAAGRVYESEINLANVAVSRSRNSGRSFRLRNFFAQTLHDRQWMEADEKNVLYLVGNSLGGGTFPTKPAGNVGHVLYKSTDGGRTFSPGVADGDGLGDLQVDKSDGTLYEAYYDGQTLSMAIRRDARQGRLEAVELSRIAPGVDMLSHWPSLDLDPAGNVYITWDESGDGRREAGVWYSYSTDRGRTWEEPVRVDTDDRTDIWPWLAAGDDGRVALAWLEASRRLPEHDAETQGGHGWRVIAAQTLNGHGCRSSDTPGFRTAVATPKPVHRGTICQGGTVCQAQLIDRRLGDYFTIEIDESGRMYAGYSDTRKGGSVALPGFVRQSGGPSFLRRPECDGIEATIVGTSRAQTLRGTPRADVIFAGDGRDVVKGKGGRDLICGGRGGDDVRGDMGNDRIFGQPGRDNLRGGRGADLLAGGRGRDVLRGEAGPDRLRGGPGDDELRGDQGRDDVRQ